MSPFKVCNNFNSGERIIFVSFFQFFCLFVSFGFFCLLGFLSVTLSSLRDLQSLF